MFEQSLCTLAALSETVLKFLYEGRNRFLLDRHRLNLAALVSCREDGEKAAGAARE